MLWTHSPFFQGSSSLIVKKDEEPIFFINFKILGDK
jgi:hypothetical protein